jgi:hypothetical protein
MEGITLADAQSMIREIYIITNNPTYKPSTQRGGVHGRNDHQTTKGILQTMQEDVVSGRLTRVVFNKISGPSNPLLTQYVDSLCLFLFIQRRRKTQRIRN